MPRNDDDDSSSDSDFEEEEMTMCGADDSTANQVVTGGQSLGVEASGRGRYNGRGLKWKVGQRIHVKFLEGPSSYQKKVERIAKTWEDYANITFKFATKGYSDIRISFNPKKGWFSKIGTHALNVSKYEPTMYLDMGSKDQVLVHSNVLHEFGHALGLAHEHKSPASPIRWNEKELIRKHVQVYGWTKERVYHDIIRKANSTNYSRFDPKSIMVYYIKKEWTTNRKSDIPLPRELSKMDKEFIGEMYPFPESENDSGSEQD